MRVTIPLEGREPCTAEVGEDRWTLIPKGTKPAGEAFNECEARYAGRGAEPRALERALHLGSCALAHMSGEPEWFYIRPTNDRSWADIGITEQPAQDTGWTVVSAPVPLDQVEAVEFRCCGVWQESGVTDGHEWATYGLAEGLYRVRYKPGFPKPEAEAQPDPRIAALEAENAALRWAIRSVGAKLTTRMEGFMLDSDCSQHHIDNDDIPHFLAARAAMERKP